MEAVVMPSAADTGPDPAPHAPRHAAILVGASQMASRERLFIATANLLAERGWRVTLLAPRPIAALSASVHPPVELVDVGRIGPFRMPRGLAHLARLYGSTPAVARFLREARPDVLMATSVPPNLVALAARRMAGVPTPVVIRQSNPVRLRADPASAGVGRHPQNLLMPVLYPHADAVIAVSAGVADNLQRTGWIPPERIHAVPNAVDLDAVAARAAEPADHAWLREDDGPPVVVAVGRLIPKKMYPTLLRAFARVLERQQARLVILGKGRERGALEALADRLGIADRVDLAGHRANPFAYMARAALFAHASRFEGMPSVLIEALACGCPVVSTDCPSGPAEILDGGAFGALVPVGDERRLADAMLETLAAPPDPERLRARARVFSQARSAAQYADILTRAAIAERC